MAQGNPPAVLCEAKGNTAQGNPPGFLCEAKGNMAQGNPPTVLCEAKGNTAQGNPPGVLCAAKGAGWPRAKDCPWHAFFWGLKQGSPGSYVVMTLGGPSGAHRKTHVVDNPFHPTQHAGKNVGTGHNLDKVFGLIFSGTRNPMLRKNSRRFGFFRNIGLRVPDAAKFEFV